MPMCLQNQRHPGDDNRFQVRRAVLEGELDLVGMSDGEAFRGPLI